MTHDINALNVNSNISNLKYCSSQSCVMGTNFYKINQLYSFTPLSSTFRGDLINTSDLCSIIGTIFNKPMFRKVCKNINNNNFNGRLPHEVQGINHEDYWNYQWCQGYMMEDMLHAPTFTITKEILSRAISVLLIAGLP